MWIKAGVEITKSKFIVQKFISYGIFLFCYFHNFRAKIGTNFYFFYGRKILFWFSVIIRRLRKNEGKISVGNLSSLDISWIAETWHFTLTFSSPTFSLVLCVLAIKKRKPLNLLLCGFQAQWHHHHHQSIDHPFFLLRRALPSYRFIEFPEFHFFAAFKNCVLTIN